MSNSFSSRLSHLRLINSKIRIPLNRNVRSIDLSRVTTVRCYQASQNNDLTAFTQFSSRFRLVIFERKILRFKSNVQVTNRNDKTSRTTGKEFRKMARSWRDPFPDIPTIPKNALGALEQFSRAEVARMFGDIRPSIISKDCAALKIQQYAPLSRADIWKIYLLRFYVSKINRGAHRASYVAFVQEHGDDNYLKLVEACGGGRSHCDELIDKFIVANKLKTLDIQTLEVQHV